MYVVVFVSVVCLLLYFLLRGLVQYRQDNNHLDYDDVALVGTARALPSRLPGLAADAQPDLIVDMATLTGAQLDSNQYDE